jgi:hypothetical protein
MPLGNPVANHINNPVLPLQSRRALQEQRNDSKNGGILLGATELPLGEMTFRAHLPLCMTVHMQSICHND